ncbi:alpha/beta fold hydrolase [Streptomyces sp. NPDC048297]|uniref:alpha/beta fold hydrolase n=1 Tax=Streptomyces sp. NPDC048297 TaxID=3365531 RepID=UPI0037208120
MTEAAEEVSYAHEVTGSGPVLLLVPGGAGHPMGLGPFTERLARRFTVVTYDPLGLAHGRLGLPVPDQRPADWADGAHQVLEKVLAPGESAYAFGISAGGVAVLELLSRHPERLAHVVAHEPPCVLVLPDGQRRREEPIDQLDGPGRPPAEGPSATPMGVFLAHVLRPFTAHLPSLGDSHLPSLGPSLGASGGRLTLTAGSDSRGQLLYETAESLAERFGGALVELPGGHLGTLDHPVEVADLLTAMLLSSAHTSS